MPADYSVPTFSPDSKELLFIDTVQKTFHRVPFENGKVDWARATQYGPFAVDTNPKGKRLKWMPGAEPHLAIAASDRLYEPPFQFDWKTNVATPLKGSFFEPPAQTHYNPAGRDGLIAFHNYPNGSDVAEVRVYRVDKDGNARALTEAVKARKESFSEAALVLEKTDDGFVVLPSAFGGVGGFGLKFVSDKGTKVEDVAFPELDRPGAKYFLVSHPTRNGLIIVVEDRHDAREKKVANENRIYWLDIATRKLSKVLVPEAVLKKRQYTEFNVRVSSDGKELIVQNGQEVFFLSLQTDVVTE